MLPLRLASDSSGTGPRMIWKLLVVAATVLIAFGRSGIRRHPLVRAMLGAGAAPARRAAPAAAPARHWLSDRMYWVLVVIAATAVATLVLGKLFLGTYLGPAR